MGLDPHIGFMGDSVDIDMKLELLREYILHMDQILKESVKTCKPNEADVTDLLLMIASDKTDLIKTDFLGLLQVGFIISLIIYIEQSLTSFCRNLQHAEAKSISFKDLTGSFMERFRKYCEQVAGLDLKLENTDWEDIRGVMEIRNCLVHNNGYMSGFSKADIIKTFVRRYKYPEILDNVIIIDTKGSLLVLDIVERFISKVFSIALDKYKGGK